MKKFFIYLLITMTGLAAQNAWAQGSLVTENGLTGSKLTSDLLTEYLTNICGAVTTTSFWGTTTEITGVPQGKAGDVYFVEVNNFWKGNGTLSDVKTQVESGVKKITKVNTESKHTTNTGTFYTHPATKANKFFFIVRRQARRSGSSYDTRAFSWYDEWSYVIPDENGKYISGTSAYDKLEATWNKLQDGDPFPSPHNCQSSLRTNHYIALKGKNPTEQNPITGEWQEVTGYNFTAYLYVPTTEPTYNKSRTYYITNKNNSRYSSTNSLVTVLVNVDGEYKTIAEAYPNMYYYTSSIRGATKVQGYTLEDEVTVTDNIPYVFFYAVKLNEGVLDDNTKTEGYDATKQNKYKVNLDWLTAFNRHKGFDASKNTTYEGMQEHYLVERSYNNSDWEPVTDKIIVTENGITETTGKTTEDTKLKPFNELTEQIGYTVWYRVTSYVEKSDGTRMSATTSNVVSVDIPGKVPFKLAILGEGHSSFDPVAGKNTFTNTIVSAESKVTDAEKVTLEDGSVLALHTVNADNTLGDVLYSVTADKASDFDTLQDLANRIDNTEGDGYNGYYDDVAILDAGDGITAAYQLVLTMPSGTKKTSNILRISNPAISSSNEKVHRSGTPDAVTCAERETFHNEVKFKASANQIGSGYYIYRDASETNKAPKVTLSYTEEGFLNSETGIYYVPDEDGYISVIDIVEDAPIAVGENGRTNVDGGAWAYAVAYYDAKNNTYGSAAKDNNYEGSKDELVLSVTPEIKAANFSQPGNYYIYTVVTINWSRTLDMSDTQPSKFEIYVKMKGKDVATAPAEWASAPVDMEAGFVKIADVTAEDSNKNGGSYTFTDKYWSKWQSENKKKYTKEELAKSLEGQYEVYVKMITTDNDKAKNSYTASPIPDAGANIYTGIEGVEAQEMDVKVVNGVVEVNGVYGMIKVIDATGAVAAEAVGTGDVTEIEGLGTGVYVVTAKDMKPTKILIK